ncbi:RNA deprotection pyrophosphohydrolase [Anaerobacillus alkalidiazotrophicus]|uniref:RNA deprotection pyrophosphohydrolase n=1 Tax=Anaerobacillus alkalidiazotrophicus TaxID=472963 RepID=UPI001FE14FEE|nr:nucleoside triphosphatase YtkD [Anaerobacillus alkalidiazotrophicus]
MSLETLLNQTFSFVDYYKNTVELSFVPNAFSKNPKHVWIICQFNNKWLLTCHEERGFEFPGGKVEEGETADQAAVREVYEETGGIIKKILKLGQYKVTAKHEIVIKDVYYAQIDRLEKREHYFETKGPTLFNDLPENIRENKQFSFLMKDGVLTHCLDIIKKKELSF